MNVSAAGSSLQPYVSPTAHKPSPTATTPVRPQPSAAVDADGDHDGDTTAGDRLDVRG